MNLKSYIAIALLTPCSIFAQNGQRVASLPDEAWSVSEWISVAEAPVVEGKIKDGMRGADGANWFVADFKNPKPVKSVKWMTTGLGIYDLYVNGNLIGEEIVKPGFTNPYKTKRSFTYDVTDAFNTGAGATNVISAQVTPGWWGDKIVTPWGHDGMLGKKCAFRGVLEIEYADGSVDRFGTDTKNWKAGIAGKVKHGGIYDGEIYDARQPEGFASASKFAAPVKNDEFKGEILPSQGAEVYFRDDLALSPCKAYKWQGVENANADEFGTVIIKKDYAEGEPMRLSKGETLVIDFGQNCAAVPSFVFNANAGTTLRCEVSEILNDGNGAKSRGMDGPEGSVHRLNLRIPDTGMYLEYTFDDSQSPVSYRPRNTFFGYRYVSLTADDDVTIESVTSIPVTSITSDMEIGHLSTGNDLVNKLISNTLWSQRSNYLSVPTDCPQRNERLGWTADTQVFAETGSFFADTRSFFDKWMRDMRDSQSDLGGFPGVSPLGQYGNEMMRLGWADAGIIVPWTIWKQTGEKKIVEDNWEAMEKYMDHINATKYDHRAHADENGNYQWGDWLSYEPLESCSRIAFDANGPLPEAVDYWNFLGASYWAIDAGMMRDMARYLGRADDETKYAEMENAAREYIKTEFFTPEGDFKTEILNTMQTPALFTLKNQIFDGSKKDKIIARLRDNFAQHGNCLQTGFLGTSILMDVLTRNGMTDIAYELLFQRKNPSWIYSIDNGATTIWERWNSYMIEHGMGPKGMNSFNHYAYGCVCEWLWETAAGISSDPAEPGFNHIIMSPIPDKRLGSVDAKYQSAAGPIESSWRYEGNDWVWSFSIPAGAKATVTLPGDKTSHTYAPGTYTISKKLP